MVKQRSVEQQLFNAKVHAAKLFQDDLSEVANRLRNIPVTLAISDLSDWFKQPVTEGFHRLREVNRQSPREIRNPNPVRWAKKLAAGVIKKSTRSHPASPVLLAQLLRLLDRAAAEEILRQAALQLEKEGTPQFHAAQRVPSPLIPPVSSDVPTESHQNPEKPGVAHASLPASAPSPTLLPELPDAAAELRSVAIKKVSQPDKYRTLRTNEAADYFECGKRTIQRWVRDGKLKAGEKLGTITIDSIMRLKKKRNPKPTK